MEYHWWIPLVISILSLLLGGGVLKSFISYIERIKTIETQAGEYKKVAGINDKIDSIDRRLIAIEAHYSLFWKILEPHLANIIHSPEHTQRDLLIDKLLNGTLNISEAHVLKDMLIEEANRSDRDIKTLAAAMLHIRVCNYIYAIENKMPDIKGEISCQQSSSHYS